jgi:hypothetical protein
MFVDFFSYISSSMHTVHYLFGQRILGNLHDRMAVTPDLQKTGSERNENLGGAATKNQKYQDREMRLSIRLNDNRCQE